MCTSRNPVSVMYASHGRFATRAWQASVVILELEKAIQGQPNDHEDIRGGVNFCKAVLAGGSWSPETSSVDDDSADSVALFAELKKHLGLVEEQRIQTVMRTLQDMIEGEKKPSHVDMASAQEFFLEASEVINIAGSL